MRVADLYCAYDTFCGDDGGCVGLLGLRERVRVYAVCTSRMIEVDDPATGCGECHKEITFTVAS